MLELTPYRARFFSVLDAKTGKIIYEKKLDQLKATTYPSPVLAGNYVLLSDEKGTTIVLEAGREYQSGAQIVEQVNRREVIYRRVRRDVVIEMV